MLIFGSQQQAVTVEAVEPPVDPSCLSSSKSSQVAKITEIRLLSKFQLSVVNTYQFTALFLFFLTDNNTLSVDTLHSTLSGVPMSLAESYLSSSSEKRLPENEDKGKEVLSTRSALVRSASLPGAELHCQEQNYRVTLVEQTVVYLSIRSLLHDLYLQAGHTLLYIIDHSLEFKGEHPLISIQFLQFFVKSN